MIRSLYTSLSSISLLLLLFTSCENKDVAPESVFSAEVEGISFFAESRQIKVKEAIGDIDEDDPIAKLYITAENQDGDRVRISLSEANEGTYDIRYEEANAFFKPYKKGKYFADRGSIHISRYSRHHIRGSFQFKAENLNDNDIAVTEGYFDIHLE